MTVWEVAADQICDPLAVTTNAVDATKRKEPGKLSSCSASDRSSRTLNIYTHGFFLIIFRVSKNNF